jgi:competence protein ComFC
VKWIIDILYPPLCLHCENSLEEKRSLFCTLCLEQLSLIEPQDRCRSCFGDDLPCQRCMHRPVFIKRQAAACSAFGPAQTLRSYLEKGHTPFLSAAASLMALQFTALDWPFPDLIVPLPATLWSRCTKGTPISHLLAKQLSSFLQRPYAAKKKQDVCDKRVLVVALDLEDDHFRSAAEGLLEGFASEVYGLAFADQSENGQR